MVNFKNPHTIELMHKFWCIHTCTHAKIEQNENYYNILYHSKIMLYTTF